MNDILRYTVIQPKRFIFLWACESSVSASSNDRLIQNGIVKVDCLIVKESKKSMHGLKESLYFVNIHKESTSAVILLFTEKTSKQSWNSYYFLRLYTMIIIIIIITVRTITHSSDNELQNNKQKLYKMPPQSIRNSSQQHPCKLRKSTIEEIQYALISV